MLTNSEGKPWSESGFQGAWGKATMRAGIRGLTFHDLRGTAVVTTGARRMQRGRDLLDHRPQAERCAGDPDRALSATDAEVAGNAIAKLNRYKTARGDQKEDENLPTALPTVLKIAKRKRRKRKEINWLGREDSNLRMAESKSD